MSTAEKNEKIEKIDKTEKTRTRTEEILITPGKRGINNRQMIDAITLSIGNDENLMKLFEQYPDVFISSTKYLPNTAKEIATKVIQKKLPDFKLTTPGIMLKQDLIRGIVTQINDMKNNSTDKSVIIDLIIDRRKSDAKLILQQIL